MIGISKQVIRGLSGETGHEQGNEQTTQARKEFLLIQRLDLKRYLFPTMIELFHSFSEREILVRRRII